MTERCGVCGKFIEVASWDTTRLCPEHREILTDFEYLNSKIFDLDQLLARLEGKEFCRPLYRMRCNLGEIKEAFKTGHKVCEYVPILEQIK